MLDDTICRMCFVRGLVCQKRPSQQGRRTDLEGKKGVIAETICDEWTEQWIERFDDEAGMVCCGLLPVNEPTTDSSHLHSGNDLSGAKDSDGRIVGLLEDFNKDLALMTPCVGSRSFFVVSTRRTGG